MSLWLELLAGVGLALIITKSYLTKPYRDSLREGKWKTFAGCPQCVGYWVGKGGYVLVHLREKVAGGADVWVLWEFAVAAVVFGLAVSAVSFLSNGFYEGLRGLAVRAEN